MVYVHENVSIYTAIKPMECPKCKYKKAFHVPVGACVRKSRRGKPPGRDADIALLKCKKCGNQLGISTE